MVRELEPGPVVREMASPTPDVLGGKLVSVVTSSMSGLGASLGYWFLLWLCILVRTGNSLALI